MDALACLNAKRKVISASRDLWAAHHDQPAYELLELKTVNDTDYGFSAVVQWKIPSRHLWSGTSHVA